VKLVAINVIGLACVLGQRNLVPDDLVVYGCVGIVALSAGYLMLRHLN
jgi:hypothetical protein